MSEAVQDEEWPPWVKDFVLPFLTEDSTRPILIAILGHFAVAIAPVLLMVFRDRSLVGAAGLFVLVSFTGQIVWAEYQVEKSWGPIMVTLGLIWALAAALAVLANYTGVY